MKHLCEKIKLIISILSVVSIGFLSGCANTPTENKSSINVSDSKSAMGNSSIESQNFTIPEWAISYSSILQEYRKFAECEIIDDVQNGTMFDDTIFTAPNKNLAGNWGNMLNEAKLSSVQNFSSGREAFGYSTKDLNNDGYDELILLLKDYTVLAIFSQESGTPKLLDAYWSRYRCAIDSQGRIYTLSGGGTAGSYGTYVISKDPLGLKLIEELIFDNGQFFKKTDNQCLQINEAQFNEEKMNNPISLIDFKVENETKITKNSGTTFIPLF